MDPSRMGRLPPPFSFQPMHIQQQPQQHEGQQTPQPMHHNSEEDEYSNSSGHNTPASLSKQLSSSSSKKKQPQTNEAGEVIRKPRGRPPGSKNKPKPPIIITRETGTGMRPHVLEIGSGFDVYECIANFARRRQRALCVLGASGTVSNVSLRQPGAPPGSSVVTLHGRFDILSLSGTFMVPPPPTSPGSSGGGPSGPGGGPPLMPLPFGPGGGSPMQQQQQHQQQQQQQSSGLTISMAGTQGQVIGGSVVGALVSVSPVLVIAASFLGPCVDRLPLDEHEPEHHHLNGNGGQGGAAGGPAGGAGLALGGSAGLLPNDPCAMALYNLPQPQLGNCQITPDMLAWAAAGGRTPF